MKRVIPIAIATLVVAAASFAYALPPHGDWWVCHQGSSWDTGYYNATWGIPVAVVVPPTAEAQTHLGRTTGATRVTPICPQFHRGFGVLSIYDRQAYQPTPAWPVSTDQSGYNYVRGPWK